MAKKNIRNESCKIKLIKGSIRTKGSEIRMDLDSLKTLYFRLNYDTENDNKIEQSLRKYNVQTYDKNGCLEDTIWILKEITMQFEVLYNMSTFGQILDLQKQLYNLCKVVIGLREGGKLYHYINNYILERMNTK